MPQSKCECEDPFYRNYENFFRRMLFWDSLDDDSIFEPWVSVIAKYRCYGWGVNINRHFSQELRGSCRYDNPIKSLDDIDQLRMPWHEIDEKTSAHDAEKITEAIGDIIAINIDRSTAYRMWDGDLSTQAGYLRGVERIMWDMIDNPELLHKLMGFLRDGILRVHEQAEKAGDWGLCAHENQAMPYSEELQDPAADTNGVRRNRLWAFQASQELTLVSPEMHEEFMLRYQIPILAKFGLTAYGCCENLTSKIRTLRKIPNLRRIAVSPFADVAKCVEQIGRDYVISYRPSPSDMVGYGFDETRIRSILERDLSALRGTHFDITLKDVQTVQQDPTRVRKWVRITRELIDRL